MNTQNTTSNVLRRALQANGAFSALSGIIFIVADDPLSSLLGVPGSFSLIGVGIALLVYAAGLFHNARRETVNQREAWIAVILDAAWVAGSAVVIFAGILTTTGNWMVAVVADIVLLFALLQLYGLRKRRHERVG